MEQGYKLYGGEVSYFTGKVRAYLDWKNLPYEEVLSDAQAFKNVILPRVGFPVIPVMITPEDACLQDTTEIIDALEQRHPGPSIYPDTPCQRLVALLLELYGDEWLVIPAMHYRWHYNREWAMREFGALNSPHASAEEQLEIGSKLAKPFAGAAVLLGAEPHMHAAVERSYEGLLDELSQHFEQHDFLLGSRPSIGDFGLYGPLYAHQYRDPWTGAHMRRHAPRVAQWVERMQQPAPLAGAFLADDAVPETLLPVLRRMFREQFPVLEDSAIRAAQWMADNPGQVVPRAIGFHEFELEGQRGKRIVRPYSLWMLQRARDYYLSLAGEEKQAADQLLERCGGAIFQRFGAMPRVARAGLSVKPA